MFFGMMLGAVSPPFHAFGQATFGATSKISMPILLDTESPLDSTLDWQATIQPQVSVEANYFSFHGTAQLTTDKAQVTPQLAIKRLELELDPTSFLSLRIGRFAYLPGTATFLSQTDFFERVDEEALLTGDFADALVSSDLLQADLFAGSAYLKLTASPVAQPILLPEPTSPWFPKKGIPTSLSFTFPVSQTLTLGTLLLSPTSAIPLSLSNLSLSAELGTSTPIADGALLFYHGIDYSPLLTAAIKFPTGLFGSYDVNLTPVYPTINAFGLNLSTSFWRMRGWLDSAFTLEKTFMTDQLSPKTFSTTTATSPYLSYTVGASVQTDTPQATFSIEYAGGHIFDHIGGLVQSLFSSALVGSARLSLHQNKLTADATIVVDANDWSTAELYTLTLAPSEQLSVAMTFPVFTGPSATDFGQFRRNHQLTTTVTWRY